MYFTHRLYVNLYVTYSTIACCIQMQKKNKKMKSNELHAKLQETDLFHLNCAQNYTLNAFQFERISGYFALHRYRIAVPI